MNFYSRIFTIAIFIILFTQLLWGQSYSILPLGNSITQGDNNHFSYRYNLWKKLVDDGLSFDFVGSHTEHHNCGTPSFPLYNGQTFDMDHEGHWGWRCDQILNGGPSSDCAGSGTLASWLTGYTPDIVLMHVGTNDAFQHQSVESTIAEIETMITTLRADNPNVIILLAKIIPSTISHLQTRIVLLNAEIPNVAVTMADPDSPIIIVDQFSGFDATTDTQADGVHPNELGEEKMAQKWRDAIQSVIPAPTGLQLDLKVMLGGAYEGSGIQRVNPFLVPGMQPFNLPPWNYSGTEQIATVSPNIVDWVLVELRDAASPDLANSSTVLARKACLLRDDGQLLNMNELPDLVFDTSVSQNLFVVIYHANHLPLLSGMALTENGGIFSYDFSSNPDQAFGGVDAMHDFGDGVYGMVAGDINYDGIVNELDKSAVWEVSAGKTGYLKADLNCDGIVNNQDKNDYLLPNLGKATFVP